MSSRKKQNKKSSGSLLLLVGIIILISFIVSIFEYIVSAIAVASVILILLLGMGMIVHGYKELKLQKECTERENGLQEERAEIEKMEGNRIQCPGKECRIKIPRQRR